MYCIAVSYAFVLNIGTSSYRKKIEKPFCQVGSRECQRMTFIFADRR
jgi:hypothetical protein